MGFDMVLRDHLSAAVRRHGRRPALVADGRTWSYAELEQMSRAVAGHLQACGTGPGDPVAVILRNGVEYVVADLAITLLGAAKVPVNLMLSADEQAYAVADSGARVCLVEADRLDSVHAARALGADPRVIVRGGGSGPGTWEEVITHAPLTAEPAVPPGARALIMYTGGTTGRPKGVVHTQRGIAANLLSHLIEMELVAEDVLLLTSPLPHSAGFLLQAALTKGALVIVEEGFETAAVLDRIHRDGVSYLFLVPTMIYRLLDALTERPETETGTVRTILYGAAPIAVERLEQGLRIFGQVFMQLYAQSEAPNFLTRLRRDDHQLDHAAHRLSSCGQAVAMARVEVHGTDGSVCGPGEVGEIVAHTPYTMEGYLNRAAETAEALRDGWLHTGDLGRLDEDGYLYLVDRKKDMIITGGLNVYSAEVEQALARLPGVREVAVTGVPHPDWGEAVIAFVVPDGPGTGAGEIMSAAREVLTAYKRPKEVVLVESLPVTAVGKVDKKKLRQVRAGG
ncbi:class I adenylate-forming enzyme family protein [Streptomyces zingiberis]|uniref:Long-chain fatty acid--CoA ligase n=1 Tax=Streptomyces zingiberis TaxID=2053010 RepID=A0ABX1BZU8_9ACTN|nr:AMP-binding protein [Streptomyces zingiberis]NJQ00184.1 long-chain fatty acid--CoA ligase [Streptomyces zingiberis]